MIVLRKLYNRLHRHVYDTLANDINTLLPYFSKIYFNSAVDAKNDQLFKTLALGTGQEVLRFEHSNELQINTDETVALLYNGSFNLNLDIEGFLKELKVHLKRDSRVIVVLYNPFLRFVFRILDSLHLRYGSEISTFITRTDLDNLAKLSGFEIVSLKPSASFPFPMFGLGRIVDRLLRLIPIIRSFCLMHIAVLRPIMFENSQPSLAIIIPARNEKGNIENALKRLPDFHGCKLEIIFIEGHSNDGTWEEILRIQDLYGDKVNIKVAQQLGKGKGDAVRLGFNMAECDLLTILDADLTMPPELLVRFYEAYCRGDGDFINGSRLVYPMEGEAMRFMNHLGNIFFAKSVSYVLGTRLGDTLCGTKLFSRKDYGRMIQWRREFGDFDPFGDFEMLFPAAILQLGIIDIPIQYRSRTYGTTNIHRFRHGFMLLRMTLIGFYRVTMGFGKLRAFQTLPKDEAASSPC